MNIVETIDEYKLLLEGLVKKAKHELKDSPQGSLRIVHNKGTVQYYHVKGDASSYISKKNLSFCRKLVQVEYNKKMISRMEKQLSGTKKFLVKLRKNDLLSPFTRACRFRQELLEPLVLDPQSYAERWKQVQYPQKSFENEAAEFYTSEGLRVRSKSEIIIAETLTRLQIPFRYEYPLKMKEGFVLHPDFYCLNVHTRAEFVWEHFGMMDDEEYVQRAVEKQNVYAKNGWISGKNMIFTMETRDCPLNSKVIEKIVRGCLIG